MIDRLVDRNRLWSRLDAAVAGDVDDPTPHGVVAARVGRVGHRDRDPRVAFDVADLLVSLDGVDEDVLAVGVAPDLGQLG